MRQCIKKPRLNGIAAKNYPVLAKRPTNSVLSSQLLINSFCGLLNGRKP